MWPFRRKPRLEVAARPHPSRLLRTRGSRPAPREHSGSTPKMVILVRTDLNMTTGKIAAQAAHAAVRLYQAACGWPNACNRWRNSGERKFVLRVNSERQMDALAAMAREKQLPVAVVWDDRGERAKTAMSILGPSDIVNSVTGHLKLY